VDYWEVLVKGSWGKEGNGDGHTACTSWMLWSKVCEVVDCVVNYQPEIIWDVVLGDLLD
jgi:hypothetical protein